MTREILKPVCNECGSEDVISDACARWNIDSQEWELSTTYDNTDCEECGGECSISWVVANTGKTPRVVRLIDTWNDATNPRVPRTDHQHHRQDQRARAANNALVREGFTFGKDWNEISNGSRYTYL